MPLGGELSNVQMRPLGMLAEESRLRLYRLPSLFQRKGTRSHRAIRHGLYFNAETATEGVSTWSIERNLHPFPQGLNDHRGRFRLEQSLPYVFALHERRDAFHNLRLDVSHPCWEQDDEQAVHAFNARIQRNAGV